MEIKAQAKHIRMSPKKVRLVADVVRGQEVGKALNQLSFMSKKATTPIEKLVKSAIANAEHNFELDKNNLYIKEIRVDEGKTLKRWKPRAYGRAAPIRKRTSHVSLVLAEIKDSGKKKAKKRDIEAPVNLDEVAKRAKEREARESKEKTSKKDEKLEKNEEEVRKDMPPRPKEKKKETKGFASKIFRRKSG